MGSAEIPRIDNLHEAALLAVGQEVHVSVFRDLPDGSAGQTSTNQLIDEALEVVTEQGNFTMSPELEKVCHLVASVAIRRLATSDGFSISFGDRVRPREIVDVHLRSRAPVIREATVTSHATKAEM